MSRSLARVARLGLAASVLLAVPACNNTPSPTEVARAQISADVTPRPIAALPSNRLGYAFTAQFKVVISEIAGQGGEVQEVTSTLYDEVSLAEVGLVTYDSADLVVFVGEKRVEAGGRLEVPQQIDYVIPGNAALKAAVLHVVVRFKDDRANNLRSSALVKVE
jgi:hypothetical protein